MENAAIIIRKSYEAYAKYLEKPVKELTDEDKILAMFCAAMGPEWLETLEPWVDDQKKGA